MGETKDLFEPSDQQLIMHYLIPKMNGIPLPCGFLEEEKDVYGPNSNPWDIFHHHKVLWFESAELENKKTTYCFTRLKNNKGRGVNNAGCGSWHQTPTTSTDIKNYKGKVIGFKKYFIFVPNDETVDYSSVYGKFSMCQYSAVDRSDYVLCVIYRDVSNILVETISAAAVPPQQVQNNEQQVVGDDENDGGIHQNAVANEGYEINNDDDDDEFDIDWILYLYGDLLLGYECDDDAYGSLPSGNHEDDLKIDWTLVGDILIDEEDMIDLSYLENINDGV